MGVVTEFQFSQEMGRAFRGYNQLKWLKSFGPAWGLLSSAEALVFVDNHDNQRSYGGNILTYKDAPLYKMAIAFMLAYPYVIARVMSSFDFKYSEQGLCGFFLIS